MTAPRAVLDRLEARLAAARLRRMRATAARALLEALCLHLFLLTAAGIAAAFRPYDPRWLIAAASTYAVYLWPAVSLAFAARRGRFRIAAVATALDLENPGAPDIFRTVLSRADHSPATLGALNTLFASWEPRLRDPGEKIRTRARGVWPALAAAFALAAPFGAARGGRLPGGAAEIYARMAFPLRALRAIPAPRLTPLQPPAQAVLGDTLTLRVRAEHVDAASPVYAHVLQGGRETRYALARTATDTASLAWGPVTGDFSLRFSTPGFRTRLYAVRAAERPRLRSLGVVITPPAYTALPPETLTEMPALVTVPPGTRLAWTARAVSSLDELTAEFREGGEKEKRIALPVQGGPGEFFFRHAVAHAGELRLELSAAPARAAEGPFRVELKIDAAPEITLLAPAGDGDLGRTLKVPVLFSAQDDHGISRVRLRSLVHREGEGGLPVPGSFDVTGWFRARDAAGAGVWDAAGLRLEPGDAVELWLEASDNDAVSGPKTARSRSVRLRLPSREEVRAAVEAGERDASVSLSSALERERRLRRESEKPDRGAAGETMPAPSEEEVRRVLSDQPRLQLRELQRQLDAEIKASRNPAEQNPLRELRREAEAQEKRLPPPTIPRAPLAEQKKSLEALNADQRALDRKLAQTPPPRAEERSREAQDLRDGRARSRKNLKRNLEDQKDLKAWMGEQERAGAAEQKRAEQSGQRAEQMRQDLQRALEQIDRAMEKGLENGTLSPEMLEKMDRIRELLEEVLDPDEKARLRRAAEDSPVEAGDLQRAVTDMLEKKEGLRENLESAVRMLEALRETRALRDAAGEMRELATAQQQLAAELEKSPENASEQASEKASEKETADLAARQEALNRQADAAMKEADRLAKNPAMRELGKEEARQNRSEARANMEKTEEKLKAPSPNRKAAKPGADLAARQLKKAAADMEKMLSKMDAGSNAAELRATLEETLDFSRWLGEADDPSGPVARSWGGEAPVRQSAVRLAKWLQARMEKLADARPFDSDVLRREAAALGFQADALATAGGLEGLGELRRHAQGAARELLKALNENQEGGGSEEGDGEGDSDAGGGASGNSGQEGLSGRMKGASARQSAVNQATQELLRSFLQGRQGAAQGAGGQKPGAGTRSPLASGGSGAGSGQGSGQSGENGKSGEPSAGEGAESAGGNEGGKNGNGLANAQQQVGESLEQLAESADDAGGAARKLRQLAEEARELEADLRRLRLSPEEIRRRQERFQTRLLEAANALEERGRERERRAESYRGGALPPSGAGGPAHSATDAQLLRELARRRDEARKLPLSPAQKRRVEWYYEQLLTP